MQVCALIMLGLRDNEDSRTPCGTWKRSRALYDLRILRILEHSLYDQMLARGEVTVLVVGKDLAQPFPPGV
jgi:hypothetical protein